MTQGRATAPARLASVLAVSLCAVSLLLLQLLVSAPSASADPSSTPTTPSEPVSSADIATSAASGGATDTGSGAVSPTGSVSGAPNKAAAITGAVTSSTSSDTPTPSTGISVVSGGDPSIPSVSDQPLPSTAPLRQAVSTFLSGVIGSAFPSIAAVAGQSPLYDVTSSDTAEHCHCTIALAISVGSFASAIASPGAGPAAAPAASAASPATSTDVGGDVPQAENVGATGNATSVSLSGHGPAAAIATSGDSGVAAGGTPIGQALSLGNVTANRAFLSVAASNFESTILNDLGPAAATLGSLPCPALFCGPAPAVSVDAKVYVPNGSSCAAAANSAEWCTLAIAVSLGGTAHATIVSPSGAVSTSCTLGAVGRPTAIAIGFQGSAAAVAHMGSGGGSCPTASGSGSSVMPVLATTGSTGNALAIGVAEQGPSGANATSGDSGQARAITDYTGTTLLVSAATATTGNSGDAVGISVGKTAASALAQSGSSGRAAALCTHCDLAGNDTIADATTGQTGGSYSLAVAGTDSYANAVSGATGDAASWAVHGTGQTFVTGQNTTSSPNNVLTNTDPGPVVVIGRSGDTGNVVVTATDLLTWVSVVTQSGDAGPVTSTAEWNADGCTLIFATFTMQCSANAVPQALAGSGSQNPSDPVVSATEPGVVVLQRGTEATSAPVSAPVNAGQFREMPSNPSGRRNVGPATGLAPGHGTDGVGGARTRLVSNDIPGPAVSPAVFAPLTSWWGLLSLCVFALFLVALILIACRYGRPRHMNTG